MCACDSLILYNALGELCINSRFSYINPTVPLDFASHRPISTYIPFVNGSKDEIAQKGATASKSPHYAKTMRIRYSVLGMK